ncbi:acetyl-CoA carboxylase [Lacticaseibacillus hulanensis]|jgi:hypothetical protein|uniref:acetyl-CoA carboxylase n=1 Tax=Lacticaseibacillus hulanensis TaxID=2493111 RepID=UPI000FD8868D|nr:acetyl-CoA carboxylase [Lacticaseibacillus hulanensis]
MTKIKSPDELCKPARIIFDRADALFGRHRNTRYWITVVNNRYGQQYNFFFNTVPRGRRHKSVPLHTLEQYNLPLLERVIGELRCVLKLTYEFVGFTGMRWPESGRVIQYRREADE